MKAGRTSVGRLGVRLLALAIVVPAALATGCGGTDAQRQATTDEPLRVAPVYASKGGALHLRVTAQTTESTIAGLPYKRMYTYKTELVGGAGEHTAGTTSSYVGAQWSVKPGDTLTIDYVNDLGPARFAPFGAKVGDVPQPLNLHTHGLTVSPSGNSDNVLLSIPQGRSNRFVIKIPKVQDHGLYWYHPHIHGLSDEQVYNGLAGHIVVGRADGDFSELDGLAVRPMMIRYNVRATGTGAEQDELIDASPYDSRGTALEVPDTPGGKNRGPMIYTVNGQLRPKIKIRAATASAPAESQVWAMTNITGSATYVLALDEVAKADATKREVPGDPVDFTIVSIDGAPLPKPKVLTGEAARRGWLLGQGGRVAILVQGPSSPSKVVRLIQVQNRSGTGVGSAYNSTGLQKAGGTSEKIAGWRDYTRDVLATTDDDPGGSARHVDTPAKLTTNYARDDDGLATAHVDRKRTFDFNAVAPPSKDEPNQFPINDGLFPFNRVDQPRAGTVEEWTIRNLSSLHHPFHVHTQAAKVMRIVAPLPSPNTTPPGEFKTVQSVTDLNQPAPATWTQDLVNLPPAKVGADGMPIMKGGEVAQPGEVVLRLRFGFLGEYVEHCHRLPHEDRGMMSLVRTIPHDPVYAVTSGSGPGARVTVYRSSNDSTVGEPIVPFPAAAAGAVPSAAVGDVDGDGVPDVAVASGAGTATRVKLYLGKERYGRASDVLSPFGDAETGASVALGDLNADGRDDLVAGMGPGARPRVAILDGETHRRLADFDAYADTFEGGVSVATGMLEEGGRISLVTGAGAGMLEEPKVNVYNFDLFGDVDGNFPDVRAKLAVAKPVVRFDGATSKLAGVRVATGNPYAGSGGFSNVLVTPLAGDATVRIFAIHQTMDHDHGGDVAASGSIRPHDYEPLADRTATRVDTLELGLPADVGTLSTPDGGRLLVAPRGGGHVTPWESEKKLLPKPGAPSSIVRGRPLRAVGSRVSGI